MIVDCHAHLVPPELLAAIRKDAARFPNVRQIEDQGSLAFAFAGAKPTRPVSKPLSDIPARLSWIAKQGIDKQVVGGWVDMFGYELAGAEGEAWARLTNDALLAAAKAGPHFVPLATVPLGDGARAGAVLKDAIKDPKKYAIFRAWAAQMDFQRPLAVAPGTPKERIAILRKGLSETLKDPALLEEAKKSKLVITPVSGEKTEKLVNEVLSMSAEAKESLSFLVRKAGK